MSDASDAPEMPAWYDLALHHAAEGGIFETATGVLLAEDGKPKSLAARMLRADAEAAAAAAEPAPPAKRRGTQDVIKDHMAAGAAAQPE